MDVGYYISELLGQHGDVNVPGLGYFAHTRVNGYYNEREGKFYPPGYSVQFDSQFLDDDDSLAAYIAEKKKISVASSKYFTEKFVLGLKQQAMTGEAALADLGWFSTTTNMRLLFRTNTVTSTDPEFFGYPAIPLRKIGYQPSALTADGMQQSYQHKSEDNLSTAALSNTGQQPFSDEFQTEQEHEEHLVALTAKKRRTTTWVFIALALVFTAAGILLTQRYDPSAFNFFNTPKEKPLVAPKIIVTTDDSATSKKDTTDAPLVRTTGSDSLSVKSTPLSDPSSRPRFELIDGTFKTMAEASKAIIKFKEKGIEAAKTVTEPGTGKLIKVSIGTFATRGEAEDALKDLLASQKADASAHIIEINPQTTGIKE